MLLFQEAKLEHLRKQNSIGYSGLAKEEAITV